LKPGDTKGGGEGGQFRHFPARIGRLFAGPNLCFPVRICDGKSTNVLKLTLLKRSMPAPAANVPKCPDLPRSEANVQNKPNSIEPRRHEDTKRFPVIGCAKTGNRFVSSWLRGEQCIFPKRTQFRTSVDTCLPQLTHVDVS